MSWAGFHVAADPVAKQRGAPTPACVLVVVTTLQVSCFALIAVLHHTFLLWEVASHEGNLPGGKDFPPASLAVVTSA